MTDRNDIGEEVSIGELVELFHSEFTIKHDDRPLEVKNPGAGMGEILYKWSIGKAIQENEDVPPGWSIEGMTLVRLNNEILDKVDEWEDEEDAESWELALLISDNVVLFYTLANEVIHGLSGELLNLEIVSDDRRSDSSLKMMKTLPQEIKEDLLFYSGIIDSGTKGEMANVRKTRNKLIHELRSRHYLTSINNVESRLERAFSVINELHVLKRGDDLFGEMN